MNNQECKVRSKIVDINSNNPIFYPFSVKTNRCSVNCNNINDPYAKICVPDTVKNLNVRVFNLMSRINGIKLVSVYVDQIKLFVIVNKDGMKVSVDVNANN